MDLSEFSPIWSNLSWIQTISRNWEYSSWLSLHLQDYILNVTLIIHLSFLITHGRYEYSRVIRVYSTPRIRATHSYSGLITHLWLLSIRTYHLYSNSRWIIEWRLIVTSIWCNRSKERGQFWFWHILHLEPRKSVRRKPRYGPETERLFLTF